ncbi:putative LMBR1 family region protein [Toxoplasma gondii RUB]|uniref:Putative LMBR1 family region protein n=1 Tax=Toxoplasma gondii RUB TaxID=935652 RepID=A0A086LWZ2_TOXGO|nr:putative LMBR1 family region protein [Toxoplasma gondii RUB]
MDWIILVFFLLYFLITLLANLKLLFYFEHSSDSSLTAPEVVCKVTILAGLQLAWLLILAVPLDAYNQHSPFVDKAAGVATAGLDMRLYWGVVAWFTALYLLFAVPFATFYYEADFDSRVSRRTPWKRALSKTVLAVCCAGLVVFVVYILCRSISLKIDDDLCSQWQSQDVSQPLKDFCEAAARTAAGPSSSQSDAKKEESFASLNMKVDLGVYLLAAMSFVGWFTFALFGGIGVAALPLDAFVNFRRRPRAISLSTFKEIRRQLGEKAKKLRFIGEALRDEEALQQTLSWKEVRRKRQFRTDMNRYRKAVFDLEHEHRQLAISMRERGENPFFSYFKLLLGVVALFMSLLWTAHTVLNCVLPQILDVSASSHPAFGFLDAFLKLLAEHSAALLALLIYAAFVCYLLICVVKGCFKFGGSVFCIIGIHPMRKDETHLNSFLFNVVLVLLSCAAVVQFTARCFRDYSHSTVAAWIFDVQLLVLPFFGFVFKYNIFIYIFLGIALISACVLLCRLCSAPPPSATGAKKLSPIGAFPSLAQRLRATTAEGTVGAQLATPDGDTETALGGGRRGAQERGDPRKAKKKGSKKGEKPRADADVVRAPPGCPDGGLKVHFAVRQANRSDSEDDDRDEGTNGRESATNAVPHKKAWGKRSTSRVV